MGWAFGSIQSSLEAVAGLLIEAVAGLLKNLLLQISNQCTDSP